MLFQIQTWLALKTKMSRKEIKPTEDIKEDDDDDPGFAKLMDNWDDLINPQKPGGGQMAHSKSKTLYLWNRMSD